MEHLHTIQPAMHGTMQMDRTIDLYQFANDMVLEEMSPPDEGDMPLAAVDTLDDEAIRAMNASEFYRFELAVHVVSGAHDQVRHYATVQEQQAEKQDDRASSLSKIQSGMKDELDRFVAKDSQAHAENIDSEAEFGQYVNSVVETSSPTSAPRAWVFPTSPREVIEAVVRQTGLNTVIERLCYGIFWSSSAAPVSDKESEKSPGEDQASDSAEALYDILATRQSCNEKHFALLRLSDFSVSRGGDAVYHMFLSCCSEEESEPQKKSWHKTTLKFESSGSPYSSQNRINNICSEVQDTRSMCAPLRLSFDNQKLWITRNDHSETSSGLLAGFEEIARHDKLESLLGQGHLQTPDLEGRLRKFRLALRLASSLHTLCLGPWIQQDWGANYLQILENPANKPIDMLDEAYISCALVKGFKRSKIFPSADQPEEMKGETGYSFAMKQAPKKWYRSLVEELRNNFEDRLLLSYRVAIEGCLLYWDRYKREGRYAKDEKKNEKLTVQQVIQKNIVVPLRQHLDNWEMHKFPDKGAETNNVPYHSYDQAHVPRGQQDHQQDNTSMFTLWGDEDDSYAELTEANTPKRDSRSFTTHMKKFIEKYINTLPEATDKDRVGRNVRIAIIDTGFHNEENDTFLSHPDVKQRIIARKNFFSPDDSEPNETDWKDQKGHGTLVARLLLQFAPRAEIFIAKITNTRTLKVTKEKQLKNALEWAGEHADIINLSFGLGAKKRPILKETLRNLLREGKLIFAAASNSGANGSRPWPAKQLGVFCIHASREDGSVDVGMNPLPSGRFDNFATLGCGIESYWDGKYRSISGTSFATPMAAAMAANIMEFVRWKFPPNKAENFAMYGYCGIMRNLFLYHMTMSSERSVYHYLMPWKEGLWDGQTSDEEIVNRLKDISAGIPKPAYVT